jgi:Lon protease-like protein
VSDDALRDFCGTARLFPLPKLVLFPHVVQGLHVFEARYRQMTADALAGDKLIAVVMLKDEAEAASEYAGIEGVACVGEIVWSEKLADGRYNIRLRGLSRARLLDEIPTGKLYRTARVELMPDAAPADLAELSRLRRELAEAVLPRFADGSPAQQQLRELFDGDSPLGRVCDILSYALPLPPEVKQLLLAEPHADRRATALAESLRLHAARADRPFPPPFSAN